MARTLGKLIRDADSSAQGLRDSLADIESGLYCMATEAHNLDAAATARAEAAALAEYEEKRGEHGREEKDLERRLASLERSISEKRSEANRLKSEGNEKAAKIREIRYKFGFVAETIRD